MTMDTGIRELRVSLDRTRTPVAFEIEAGREKLPASLRLANISRSGMFLECSDSFPVHQGSSVNFVMRLESESDEVSGVARVRWVRGRELGPYMPRGFGLQVIEFHDNAEKKYLEFLESCLLQLRITDLMDPNFLQITPVLRVEEAVRILNEKSVDCLIVSDPKGAPLGTFTTGDVTRICRQAGYLYEPVGRCMQKTPLTLSTDDGTDEAYEIMRNGTLMYIPVVEDGIAVGLLQTRDLVRYWTEFMDLQAKRLARNYDRAISVIAHDLRTPIGLIKTTNAMLTSGELTPDEYFASGLPETMDRSCEMMMVLIDDILDIQRIKVGAVRLEQRSIDLEELVHKVVRAFLPTAHAKRISLELQIPTPLPRIKADPLRLEQVFNNLISNALKFTHEGGKVTLGACAVHSKVSVWVSDTGPGIAESERHKLFREYSELSNRPTKGEKSTGLGLAIAKRLVDAHGGTIEVDTTQGVGTTFTILLPIGEIQ